LRSIYFVNPASDVPTYFGAEVYAGRGLRPTTLIAELTLPTLAAPHLEVTLCDECARPLADLPGDANKIDRGIEIDRLHIAFSRTASACRRD